MLYIVNKTIKVVRCRAGAYQKYALSPDEAGKTKNCDRETTKQADRLTAGK